MSFVKPKEARELLEFLGVEKPDTITDTDAVLLAQVVEKGRSRWTLGEIFNAWLDLLLCEEDYTWSTFKGALYKIKDGPSC